MEAIKYANEVGSSNIENCNIPISTMLRAGLKTILGFNDMDIGTMLGSIATNKSDKETFSNIEHI
jgi:hypothetical protein